MTFEFIRHPDNKSLTAKRRRGLNIIITGVVRALPKMDAKRRDDVKAALAWLDDVVKPETTKEEE